VLPKRKERTYDEYKRLLTQYIEPVFGARAITELRRQDIAGLQHDLADRPNTSNRCLALIDAVWNWAVRREVIPALPSPTKGSERSPEKRRKRFLTPDELRRLGKALRDAETVGLPWVVDEDGPKAKHLPKSKRSRVVDPHAVAAIRLLMLTGARLREILEARWDYIDWERGLMFLPDSKTGRKTLYLSDAALAVLSAIPKVGTNPHIIPGDKKGAPRSDLKRPWVAIARAAGLVGDGKQRETVRLHDLRHTFASLGVGSSLGLPVIGKLLGHSQASTTQRYAHLDADPMHKAANLIGSQIAAALSDH
jgi:integrase